VWAALRPETAANNRGQRHDAEVRVQDKMQMSCHDDTARGCITKGINLRPPPTTITLGAIVMGYLKKDWWNERKGFEVVGIRREKRENGESERNARVVI
jgi:hypothetical protein